MLNQSASLEQSGFFCLFVCFFFFSFSHCPALFRKEKVEGSVLAIIHSFEERGGSGGRVDGLTDATVLNSLNSGLIKTGNAVPRQVLCLYLCKVLCAAVSEP